MACFHALIVVFCVLTIQFSTDEDRGVISTEMV